MQRSWEFSSALRFKILGCLTIDGLYLRHARSDW